MLSNGGIELFVFMPFQNSFDEYYSIFRNLIDPFIQASLQTPTELYLYASTFCKP